MSELALSPFIAPYTDAFCRALSEAGGVVLNRAGDITTSMFYRSKEGITIARIVQMVDVSTRHAQVFMLNEVTGEYTNGNGTLWPLTHIAYHTIQSAWVPLHRAILNIVDDFLTDVLPDPRPRLAHPERLRTLVLCEELGDQWATYWKQTQCARPNKRHRSNTWRLINV